MALELVEAFLENIVVPDAVDVSEGLNDIFGRLLFGNAHRFRVILYRFQNGLKGFALNEGAELGGIIRELRDFRSNDRGVEELGTLINP